MDAKDILGLPKNALPSQEKKSKPPKESQRKPDGISREVYALTGGLAPLMPAIDVNQLKRKVQSDNEKITWQWLPFTNSARKDDLQLYHWVRVVNGTPPTGDYSFAKYNKSVDVVKYTDEEYEKYLTDPAWTKEETDQLFDLCEQFDLRFVVVADRFPSSKTVEELKDRYYSGTSVFYLVDNLEQYNASQETERKRALNLLLSHTKQQERKDVEVLTHAKRITEARKAIKASAVSELPVLSDIGPHGADNAIITADDISPSTNSQFPSSTTPNPVSETASVMASLRTTSVSLCAPVMLCFWLFRCQFLGKCFAATINDQENMQLRVYLRTYALEQMVQAASSSAGLRTIKRVEQTLQDLGLVFPLILFDRDLVNVDFERVLDHKFGHLGLQGRRFYFEWMDEAAVRVISQVNLKPKVPTKAVCVEHLELRKEILTLLNLQKQLQYKEAEGSSFRDGSYTETPGTPPKQQSLRAVELDRTFTPDSVNIGGDRFGKREQKRKGPGRLPEAPSSPAQSKRPRKYKASD
ncbi:hypothetical protein DH2020_048114 [Rehmannia glutinosa]|uniref:Myb-like domain-containing protein n=1 Tax=Rehmannia glutinosa TaxID=99300 RepID=A0ABR0U6I1_REHGL